LVLNECNEFQRNGFRTLYRMERELGMRGVLAPASSGFHVALFVREGRLIETTLLDHEVHHAALAATLELGELRLQIIAAHLTPFGGQARLAEVQQLIRFMREKHVFVMGDLNSISPVDAAACSMHGWLPRRRARHLLAESGGAIDTRAISTLLEAELVDTARSGPERSAPPTALTPLIEGWQDYQVRIDYILASPAAAERVVRHGRVDGELAELASDHYPLFVEVEL
jgi:endonuclease/exonuclease/phosphatase family metal-dependent hydrolase